MMNPIQKPSLFIDRFGSPGGRKRKSCHRGSGRQGGSLVAVSDQKGRAVFLREDCDKAI